MRQDYDATPTSHKQLVRNYAETIRLSISSGPEDTSQKNYVLAAMVY